MTARLIVRPPRESDRQRFIELFGDPEFMMFAPGVMTGDQATARFDHMVDFCQVVPFGKQPIVERASGVVIGYTGVDSMLLEGRTVLEWGYRLARKHQGIGYATEASRALLAKASRTYAGELLALIDPENAASQNVCGKLGFTFSRQSSADGRRWNVYTLSLGHPDGDG